MKVFLFLNLFVVLTFFEVVYGGALKPTTPDKRSEATDIEPELLESFESTTKPAENEASQKPATYDTPNVKLPETWDTNNWSSLLFTSGQTETKPPVSVTNTTTDSDGRRITTTITMKPTEWTQKTIRVLPVSWFSTDPESENTPIWRGSEQPDFFNPHNIPKTNNVELTYRQPVQTVKIDDMPITAFATNPKSVDDAFEKALPEPTLKTTNIDFEPNLTTDVQDILKKAGIDPRDTSHLNADPVVRTRVEPDGRVIKTTYKIRTVPVDDDGLTQIVHSRYPSLFSQNPFSRTEDGEENKPHFSPSVKDILRQAGIDPSESQNGQPVTRTHTTPDGTSITTTYHVRTIPVTTGVEPNWRSKVIPMNRYPPSVFPHSNNMESPRKLTTDENFEPIPVSKDIELLRPTGTTTSFKNNFGTAVQNLLSRGGIGHHSIEFSNPRTRTHMEPDGSLITTIFKTRPIEADEPYSGLIHEPLSTHTFPTLLTYRSQHPGYGQIPLGAHPLPSNVYPSSDVTPTNPSFGSNFPNANGVSLSGYVPTTTTTVPLLVVTTTPTPLESTTCSTPTTTATPSENSKNGDPIDAFLDRTKLNVDDELSEKGESERTIITEDGRILTVKLLLSSVKNDADQTNEKKNNAIKESKPIK